jgi:hypothetical protein
MKHITEGAESVCLEFECTYEYSCTVFPNATVIICNENHMGLRPLLYCGTAAWKVYFLKYCM